MNAGAMIAIHAAAAAAKAKSDALDAFRLKGATAADRACALYDLGLAADNSALRDLFASGVLRAVDARGRAVMAGEMSGAGDRFYLDEAALIAQRDGGLNSKQRRQVTGLLILFGLLGLVIGIAVLISGSR